MNAGQTRLTVRLELPDRSDGFAQDNVRLDIDTHLVDATSEFGVPAPGNDANTSDDTQLIVTPPAANDVVFDLYDAEGGLIAEHVTTVDMRRLDAGTYHVRVYRPDVDTTVPGAALDARAFSFSVTPPAAGQTRATFFDPDRDTIHGGDGNDFILGNGDIDALFGDSGTDVFTSDLITVTLLGTATQTTARGPEIRDLKANDADLVTNVPAADSVSTFKTKPLDRPIDISDPGLRLALAKALGIAVTDGFDGLPHLSRPIMASDLASLTQLDASNRGIVSLPGWKTP